MRGSRLALMIAPVMAVMAVMMSTAAHAADCQSAPTPETLKIAAQGVVRLIADDGGQRRVRTAFVISREEATGYTFVVTTARGFPLNQRLAVPLGTSGKFQSASLASSQTPGLGGNLAILRIDQFAAVPLALDSKGVQQGQTVGTLGYSDATDTYDAAMGDQNGAAKTVQVPSIMTSESSQFALSPALEIGYVGGPIINGCGQVLGIVDQANAAISVAEIINLAKRMNLSVTSADQSAPAALATPLPATRQSNSAPLQTSEPPASPQTTNAYLVWAIVGLVLLLGAGLAAFALRRGGGRPPVSEIPTSPTPRPVTVDVPAPPPAAAPPSARPRTRVVGVTLELVGRGDRRVIVSSDDFADSGNIVELYRDERDPTGRGRRRVFLNEPEISNPHASFTYDSLSKQVSISDLRSRNKTFLNGESEALGEVAVVLKDGDRVTFAGVHEFSVRLSNG